MTDYEPNICCILERSTGKKEKKKENGIFQLLIQPQLALRFLLLSLTL